MEYRKFDGKYYVRLDPGDELIETLTGLCEKEKLTIAEIYGIGGCSAARVGVFDTDAKVYREQEVNTLLELVSLTGNLTAYDNKPYLHLHALFAYQEGDALCTLAGHLLYAMIGLTGEIVITPAVGNITRRYIEELGIRIWDFKD